MVGTNKFLLLLLSLMAMLTPISMDIYLPALGKVVSGLDTNYATAQITISIFMLGVATMQLFFGPLSDHFGRKKICYVGLTLYLIATFICIVANDIWLLISARFLQAAGASVGMITAFSTIRDQYEGETAGKIFAIVSGNIAIAPILAPIVGAQLAEYFGWRSCFIFAFIIGVILFFSTFKFLPETREASKEKFQLLATLKKYGPIAKHRTFILYASCILLVFSGFFSFIANSPDVLINDLGVSMTTYSYLFGFIASGLIAGNITSHRIIARVGINKLITLGGLLITVASLSMMILDIIVGYKVWTIIFPMFFISYGIALVLPTGLAGLLVPFQRQSGAATSLVTSLRFASAALVATIISYLEFWKQWPLVLWLFGSGILILFIISRAKFMLTSRGSEHPASFINKTSKTD